MDLEALRAFIAVAEAGSFLGASRTLGVSRTTLRRHVGVLEAAAGVPLLENTRQGVTPTEAGRLLMRHGRTMMQEAGALLASIREVGKTPSGVLRVVLPVGLPPHLLLPMFTGMRAAYPRLQYEARFSNDPLGEGMPNVDIAIHFGEDAPKGSWISHVVLRVREWLVASRVYLERRGTPRKIQDLASHDLFAWQAPGDDPRIWPTLRGTTFTVEPVLVATDIHFLRHCCRSGLGIGLLPDALLPDPGMEADALVPVLADLVGRERPVRISVPKVLADLPKIKVIIDLWRDHLTDL